MTDDPKPAPAELAEAELDAAQGGATIGALSAAMQKVREPSAHAGGVNFVFADGSVRS